MFVDPLNLLSESSLLVRDGPKEDVRIRNSVTIWSFSEPGDGYSTDAMTDRTGPDRVKRVVIEGMRASASALMGPCS